MRLLSLEGDFGTIFLPNFDFFLHVDAIIFAQNLEKYSGSYEIIQVVS